MMAPGDRIEIACDQLISAEHSLQHAIAQANKTKLMRAVTQGANPYLEELNLRLAAMISHEYPDSRGGSLLSSALSRAVDAYTDSAERGGRIEDNERTYLTTLLNHAAAITDFQVHGLTCSGTTLWRPFEQPLIEWASSPSIRRLVFSRVRTRSTHRHAGFIFLVGSLLTFDRAGVVCDMIPHPADCLCLE